MTSLKYSVILNQFLYSLQIPAISNILRFRRVKILYEWFVPFYHLTANKLHGTVE